jgi:Threonine dehydrogenase and related Zn-dependent dehydrogenases
VDVINVVKEMTDGAGADVVIPACSSPEIIVQGIRMLKKRGRIVFFSGLPNEHKNISIDPNLLHYKEIQVCGAYGCTSDQNRKAVNLLSKRKINVNYLITERISLDGIIRGFELITAHKAMKVVITEF